MQSLTVYDLWPGLPPIQRGALCAVGMMAGFRVRFAWSDGSFYLDAGEPVGERAFFLRLHHFLHRDGFQPRADKKWIDICWELCERLAAFNAKGAEKGLSWEEFAVRLEKIRRLTLSLPVEEDAFLLRFQAVYGQRGGFQPCRERLVNPVNRGETDVYKEIFEQSADGVESIDHAVQTLLHLLPGDARRILDVGSGPGYVNRCLPPDRAVLAMDIDPDILRANRCQTCVGDILDIPLAENTVDLCMACDVLEHIEPEKLPRAIAELCRVSGRYLYLQVPYQEQLPASWARCPQCGHIWHVNFHKSSFSLQKLLSLPDEGWEPVAVGFTGEISYQGDELQENRLLECQGLYSCRVEGWSCPVCGTRSESYLREPFDCLHAACSASPQEEAAPRYSEIAVLFCKKDMAPPERVRRLLASLNREKEAGSERTSRLRFCPDMLVSSVYTGSELLPFALCGNSCFDWERAGQLLKESKEQPAFVSVAFPLRPSSGDILRIRGNTEEENQLTVCMLDAAGQEALLGKILLDAGTFDEILTVDYRFSASRAFVKIYFAQEGLFLHSVELSDASGSAYQLYRAKKGNHLTLFQDSISYFWYVPPEEPVRILPRVSQWLSAAEKRRTPSPALLPDYIGSLRGIIGEQRRDYERSGAQQAGEIARLSGRLETVQGELRETLKRESSLQDQNGEYRRRLEISDVKENELHRQLEEREAAAFLLESVRGTLQLRVEEQAMALALAGKQLKISEAKENELHRQLEEREAAVFLLESVRGTLQLRVEEQAAALALAGQQATALQMELIRTKEQLKISEAKENELHRQLEERGAVVFLLESVRSTLQLRVEEQAAALALAGQQAAVLQMELIRTKEQLALCGTAPVLRPKKRLALRAGAATVLKKLCRFSIRVVHRIPYLYPLLVQLGVKKAYNRLKLKIKSGGVYE